jgi:hypothetical protein
MKAQPIDPAQIRRTAEAIRALSERGCPAAAWDETESLHEADVALRRWRSQERRQVRPRDRRADLVAGLIAAFEREPELVGPLKRDYECVADVVIESMPADEL